MLRDIQADFVRDIYAAWDRGARNVMGVFPTGGGKTVVGAHIVKDRFADQPVCVEAHRQELVGQLALAFNREEMPHGLIAPKPIITEIIKAQMELHGRSFYNPSANIRVAGVDTLRNYDATDRWCQRVKLLMVDEGHHALAANKWGRTFGMFPNAQGLLLTAHALRADGAGLGRSADGVVDELVVGPPGRNLINRGYLTDYRIFCPPSDITTEDLTPGESGEFNMTTVRERVNSSRTIVGDVVKHYKAIAEGELWITFAVDIKAATKYTDAYNAAGIPAALITAKTPIAERAHYMRLYRERKIIQLVNVDCLGEGTDVPACRGVSMVRPSASFQLVAQQFGRMLRIMVSDELNRLWYGFSDAERLAHIAASTKPNGILIDHVGNIAVAGGLGRHRLPDSPRSYSLDRREKKSKQPDDAIPLRGCLNPDCLQPYENTLTACPYCGTARPAPKGRSSPEHVEGDLVELDPEVLKQLRGEIDRIDLAPRVPTSATPIIAKAIQNRHYERQQVQHVLRDAMATWAGWQNHQGRSDRETMRRFWHHFGIDIATAQTLGAREAGELDVRIRAQLSANNIVKATE